MDTLSIHPPMANWGGPRGRCRAGGLFDAQSLTWRGGCGGSRGSDTSVASCNYFPSLAGCTFLQTHPMSLCPLALDADRLQTPAPRGDSAFKSSFRMPLMCASRSLGTRSVDDQVLSFSSWPFSSCCSDISASSCPHIYVKMSLQPSGCF